MSAGPSLTEQMLQVLRRADQEEGIGLCDGRTEGALRRRGLIKNVFNARRGWIIVTTPAGKMKLNGR